MRAFKKKITDIKALQELVPLNALSDQRFAEVMDKIVVEEIRTGRYLFRKGDRDNQSVYLLDGKINLIDGHRKVTSEIEGGTDFSRYPVANQQPRTLSARAVTKVVVARIDSDLLDAFLTWEQSPGAEVNEINADGNDDWMTRLLQSEAFEKIPPAGIQRLLMKMKSLPVQAGEAIVREGDDGDFFYTIHSGRCIVTRKSTAGGEDEVLAELSNGECFGEEALVSDSRRNATVTMLTDGMLMRLAKKDFIELLQKPLVRYVTFEVAAAMVDDGAVWVDVRSEGEYEDGAIEESVNIPLSTLRGEITELVFNSQYIIYCDTGSRSVSAAFILSHKGFEVYVLESGLNGMSPDELAQAGLPQHDAERAQVRPAVVERQDAEVISFDQGESVAADDNLLTEFEALRRENEALHQQVEGHQRTAHSLFTRQLQLQSAEEEKELLREQNVAQQKDYQQRLERLQLEIKESEDRIQMLQAGTGNAVPEDRQLQEQAESVQQALKVQIEHLEGESIQNAQHIEALQAELQTTNKQATRLQAESAMQLQEQQRLNEVMRIELEQSRRDSDEFQDRIAAVQQEKQAVEEGANTELSAQQRELQELREQSAQAASQVEALQAELQAAQAQISEFRVESETHHQEKQQLETLRSELARSEEHARAMQQENEALQRDKQAADEKSDSTLRESNATLEQLNHQLAQVQQENGELVEKLAEAQRNANEIQQQVEANRSESDGSQARLQQLQQELESNSNRFDEQVSAYERQLADLGEQLEQAREAGSMEQQRLKSALEKYQQYKTESEARLEQQQQTRDEVRQEQQRLTDELEMVVEERDKLGQKLAVMEHDFNVRQQEIDQLNETIASLTNTADQEVQKLNEHLADERARASRAEESADEQVARVADLQEELGRKERTVSELQDQLQVAKQQSEESRQMLLQHDAQVQALEQEHQMALQEVRAELGGKHDLEMEMRGQIERLGKKLEQSDENLRRMQVEARENDERLRNELAEERRARTDERAQMGARQKELKQQLAEVAGKHEGVLAGQSEMVEQAREEARQEERARLQNHQEQQEQSNEQVVALQAELEKLRKETAATLAQERERIDSDLNVSREQGEQAKAEIAGLHAQLKQLAQERDEILSDREVLEKQLAEQREESSQVPEPASQDEATDTERLREELEDARTNIEIAVRQRTEAETELERITGQRDQLLHQLEEGGLTEVNISSSANGSAGKAEFEYAVGDDNRGRRRWLGAIVGIGVAGIAALIFWLMLTMENPMAKFLDLMDVDKARAAWSEFRLPLSLWPDAATKQEDAATKQDDPATKQEDTATNHEDAATVQDSRAAVIATVGEQPAAKTVTQTQKAGKSAQTPAVEPPRATRSFRDALAGGGRGPLMLELPAGTYMMGSGGSSLVFEERPQHRVKLASFSISKYEVSFAEYDRFARATGRRLPHDEKWGRDGRPVINVTWKDARAYTRWLSKQTGHQYRLPTEAEWEYAARGGTTRDYWWDPAASTIKANCFNCGSEWDGNSSAPVGNFPANSLGLHDTAGNVQEWTEDCYHPSYQGAPADGSARERMGCTKRVVRGGSYSSPLESLRSNKRSHYDQDTRIDNLGFRVVRVK